MCSSYRAFEQAQAVSFMEWISFQCCGERANINDWWVLVQWVSRVAVEPITTHYLSINGPEARGCLLMVQRELQILS